MFRLIGALLGYYLYGFLGGLIGFFFGSFVDRIMAYGVGGVNPLSSASRQTVFLQTVFILMGKLAKVDGHISKDEIAYVEQFMQKLSMSAEHRQQGIALFKQGTASNYDIEPSIRQFLVVCGHTHSLRQMLLVYLIVMALSDGSIDNAEEHLLIEIARQLGYNQTAFQSMLEMVLNQSHFASGQATSATALEDAYKALGVPQESTDAEVKKAYRKLISQYHPDKLIGQGLPADMIAVATEQAKEVQLAYDLIMKNRTK